MNRTAYLRIVEDATASSVKATVSKNPPPDEWRNLLAEMVLEIQSDMEEADLEELAQFWAILVSCSGSFRRCQVFSVVNLLGNVN
jgi:hypothetical protein